MKLTSKQRKIVTGKLCGYCGGTPEYVDSSKVYNGRSYGMIWYCKCGAYVGCHPGTDKPLGRLANKALREAKKEAHKHFDTIWKLGLMNRAGAYKWLSEQLGIPPKYTHIGMFGIATCEKVASLSVQYLQSKDIRHAV